MIRPVGEDPAVFAIALESLARRGFCGRRSHCEAPVGAG